MDPLVKIIDFNVSKFSESKKSSFKDKVSMWTQTGTVAFSAPEKFNYEEYTEIVDMWSAGVVLYIMLSG